MSLASLWPYSVCEFDVQHVTHFATPCSSCGLLFQAPCSPPESLKLCSPMDHNSYSPQDSFSSSSSSCYDSPTRMESSYHGFTSEHYQYQRYNLQDCYCLPHCWPGQQESFSAPEHAPYYPSTDYPYACPVEENYYKRDLPMSSEMCYNVL